jgi:hypothetical protein
MANNNWADKLESEVQLLLDDLGITDNVLANKFSILLLKVVSWYLTGLEIPSLGKVGDRVAQALRQQDMFDMAGAYREANNKSLSNIRTTANVATTVSGGVWGLFSWLGLVIDVIALVDGMIRASLLIGGVYAKRYDYTSDVLEREDFLCVIAYWVGEKGALDSTEAKLAFYQLILGEDAAKKIALKWNTKTFTKGTTKVGIKPIAKSAIKAAEKVIKKFITKATSKTAGKGISTVPIIAQLGGCLVNASINRWFMGQLLDASEEYYDDKFSSSSRLSRAESES